MIIVWKTKKLFKAKKCQKIPKKLKIFSLKIHHHKIPITFLNKGTKHKKNYMEGLNSKNKNIKGVGSP